MRSRRAIFAGLVLACAQNLAAGETVGILAYDAWARESPPGVAVTAGYVELRNNTTRPLVLTGASSAAFESVSVHHNVEKAGVVGMAPLSRVTLAPNAILSFAPGGLHLMMMNPQRALRAGDRTVINLEFHDGSVLPVEFEVRR